MNKKHIPPSAITIRTYAELANYAGRFATGKFNLLAVVGSAGLGKTKTFETAMKGEAHCLIKGHARAFMLYKSLYDNLDLPVIIDDADTLYEDRACKPLLKCLCDTVGVKTLQWHTKAIDDETYPRTFKTRSQVAILCNEWFGMSAIADRGIFVNFTPTPLEVHRRVADLDWLKDDEIYRLIGDHLHLVSVPSMRYYHHAKELKMARIPDWQDTVLNMLNPDLDRRAIETVSKMMTDDTLTEKEKVAKFERLHKLSRATYFRYKKILGDAS